MDLVAKCIEEEKQEEEDMGDVPEEFLGMRGQCFGGVAVHNFGLRRENSMAS